MYKDAEKIRVKICQYYGMMRSGVEQTWNLSRLEKYFLGKINFLFFLQFSMNTHCFVAIQAFVEFVCPYSYQFN